VLDLHDVRVLDLHDVRVLDLHDVQVLDLHDVQVLDLHDVQVLDLHDVQVLDLHDVRLPRRPARKNAVLGVTNLLRSLSSRALCLVSQGSEPPLKRCLPPHSRLPKVAFSPPILEG